MVSREVAQVDQRGRFWFAYGVSFLNLGSLTLGAHSLWLRGAAAIALAPWIGVGVYRWMEDSRLKTRYASNVELLKILREREPGLADQIGDPFAYKPLLDAWNRRLEKRALLWRVDRFLSGKGGRED